ncbi:hypothetical protein [Acutalibacter sp. JLR.KK004]|jgi:hypothetical protein|uniref:hypothetical protein n=1 Tax=Acutalibacter sp. JLR.KK004 TaxID=3112622 RepID=UPI002FF085DC
MEALIKFGAQGCVPSRWAWFIVNALENRYNPGFQARRLYRLVQKRQNASFELR